MPVRTIFNDDQMNEMDLYVNTNGKLFIQIQNADQEPHFSGSIVLDMSDVDELIQRLNDLKDEMQNLVEP